MYRIFIDEVGHHNLKSAEDPNERYLGLMGIIVNQDHADNGLTQSLNVIKIDIFGTTKVVLHRRELIDKRPPPFDRLRDPQVRTRFDTLILQLIRETEFSAITTLIDKKAHVEQYQVWQSQPYHYCLTAILERYVRWLQNANTVGDVLVESRGKAENMKLEAAYKRLYKFGTESVGPNIFQRHLSSNEIKLKLKSENISGLQIVDLLANPACRDLICRLTGESMRAEFGRQVVEILYASKYRRRWDGVVAGWGTKILP